MAKTNFTKVEDSLKAGLQKMSVKELGQLADIAQGSTRPELKGLMEKAAKVAAKAAIERKALIHITKKALKEIEDAGFYTTANLSKEQAQELLDKSPKLTKEEWEKIKKFKEKIVKWQRENNYNATMQKDELLVESERKKHLNKRFNVKEKWLPMK